MSFKRILDQTSFVSVYTLLLTFTESHSRFGTYPRSFTPELNNKGEGHRTFPRASMSNNRRTDLNLTASSFRSLMSRGSEGTLSTSSSSSGFPPDPEDSPEGRIFKRNSNDGSPIFNPALSKCKYTSRTFLFGVSREIIDFNFHH